ncbi:MAG: CoA transferase, partial [Desulfobacterales bacterium]|nr:CoA transferase [Desulfobacterales bacterium]
LAFFGSLMAALYHRERTGLGTYVGTSLIATGAWVNGVLVQAGLANAEFEQRPARENTSNPMQCHFLCADDRWIMLMGSFDGDETSWAKLVLSLGLDSLKDDERLATYAGRSKHCSEVVALLDAVFRTRTAAQWLEIIRRAGFVVEILSNPSEVAQDPRMRDAEAVLPMDGSPDFAETVASPVWFRDFPKPRSQRAPHLGEHTEQVMREFGFAASEISALRDAGAVQIPGQAADQQEQSCS